MPVVDLAEHVAIVTGGTSGIGLATVRELHNRGASVVVTARKQAGLDAVPDEFGDRVAVLRRGVDHDGHAASAIELAIEHLGSVDILVHNAATSPHFGPLQSGELKAFDKTFTVNVRSPLVSREKRGGSGGNAVVELW